jgi:uncharacterized membrane protein YdjX (TVP38/TMEM64 family)
MPEPEPAEQDGSMAPVTSHAPPAPRSSKTAWIKWLALGALLLGLAALPALGLSSSLQEYLKRHRDEFIRWKDDNPWSLLSIFFAIYVGAVGLSLPIAVPLSIAAGVLYGRWYGTIFVSFASTTGATLAFLGSRYLFRDAVHRRFGDRLGALNRGVAADGAFYLFSLRLQPIVPFWLINLGMGLTSMRVGIFWSVSQVGMLPGTFIYVNVGTSAGEIDNAKGVWPLLLSLALLGPSGHSLDVSMDQAREAGELKDANECFSPGH